MAVDRRAFIAGAVASMFTGMTVIDLPKVAWVVAVPANPDPLWQMIYDAMLLGYRGGLGEPDASGFNLIRIFTDSLYGQLKFHEIVADSIARMELHTTPVAELEDWAKELRYLPPVTVTLE